jgi:hypothetical protein
MVLAIKTSGSPFERGLQQGTILRDRARAALEQVFSSKMFNEFRPKWVPLAVMKWGLGQIGKKNIRSVVEKVFPHHHEKMVGLSQGLGISTNLNYGLHFLEVLNGDPQALYRNPPVQACSMLFALPEATTDGEILFGRNYDFPKILQPYQMVRTEEPDGAYKNISLTQYPFIGNHMAMNECGVVIGYNYGRSWKSDPLDYRRQGVAGTIFMQELIEQCKSTQEVIDRVTAFQHRSNGIHFGVVDESGDAAVVETTTTRWAIRRPENGLLAHSNIYVTPELEDANLPLDVRFKMGDADFSPIESPIRRFKRANALLAAHRGSITTDTLKNILRDHDSGDPGEPGPNDFSLCTHGTAGITLASIIIRPEKREFWVIDNQPRTGEYEKFVL